MAGEEGDDRTQDIFTGFHTDIEKKIWMIQAKLGLAPNIDMNEVHHNLGSL